MPKDSEDTPLSDEFSADSVEGSATTDPTFNAPVETDVETEVVEVDLTDYSIPNWFALLMEYIDEELIPESEPESESELEKPAAPSLADMNAATRRIRR